MFELYTEEARRVIFFARAEASQFGSPYIETEHLLLGLLREDKAPANRFLRSHTVESIRKQIEERTTIRGNVSTSVYLPLSHECMRVLAYGAEEAKLLNHKHIGTEHVLLGLLCEEKCLAAEILYARGLRLSTIRKQLSPTTVEVATKVTVYPCKICGTLNPTDVCGFSGFAWHERIAELEAALKQAEDILAHELEESMDDVRNRKRIEDALQVIRKVLPGKEEK
jgi:ATP-dependent Clp protease ATP-binding subunit ClpA